MMQKKLAEKAKLLIEGNSEIIQPQRQQSFFY